MNSPMKKFHQIFQNKCSIIGMVHVGALPGSPLFAGSIDKIVSKAHRETETYLKHEVDGIIIENMHDVPYIKSKHFGPETTAAMTRICTELKNIIPKKTAFGIQVLTSGNTQALAIAKTCSMDFIRAEGFVFSHIGDEGFIDAEAGLLMRYRKKIEAENILVLTDIKKKHSSHAITNDISVGETAKAAEFFLSDGVILTGASTGDPANITELQTLKQSTALPILIGSGVTYENLDNYITAQGLIVGSHFKKGGKWSAELDEERIGLFMQKMSDLRRM
ncbi:unnamed protein product [Phaedon cochleariae]|uniref:Uncharacterized protein n=1 Tax=Phaedon cochleariae TaxID=80249 RepID=A0A9N9SJN8_PHACE|nr:unnamed protein product [Phaedon cochleariae]